jgi:hypothetical protein
MAAPRAAVSKVPVYCYQCVAGPDLLKIVVRDGVAVGVEPNQDVADVHPACGKVCVRAYALVAAAAGALMVTGQAWMKAVLIRQAGQLRPITLPAERLLGRRS